MLYNDWLNDWLREFDCPETNEYVVWHSAEPTSRSVTSPLKEYFHADSIVEFAKMLLNVEDKDILKYARETAKEENYDPWFNATEVSDEMAACYIAWNLDTFQDPGDYEIIYRISGTYFDHAENEYVSINYEFNGDADSRDEDCFYWFAYDEDWDTEFNSDQNEDDTEWYDENKDFFEIHRN